LDKRIRGMNMSENKIGDILGGVMGGMMGATAPMMTGIIRSMLSPGMIKSVTGIIPDLLGAVVEAISSIDIGELISSTLGAILPVAMKLLDPLLDMLGPIIEAVLDMLSPILAIVGPLLEAVGPIFDALTKAVGPILGALSKGLGGLGSSG
jgi:phage-related protein